MRRDTLALTLPPREPDPILLDQLTALAAASVAPAALPWWQRVTIKSGAAAIGGVLLISGTAYAAHGDLGRIVAPIVAPIVNAPAVAHAAHHRVAPARHIPPAATRPAPAQSEGPSHRNARARAVRGAGIPSHPRGRSQGSHAQGSDSQGNQESAAHVVSGALGTSTSVAVPGWLNVFSRPEYRGQNQQPPSTSRARQQANAQR